MYFVFTNFKLTYLDGGYLMVSLLRTMKTKTMNGKKTKKTKKYKRKLRKIKNNSSW